MDEQSQTFMTSSKPVKTEPPKVDHLAEIAALAVGLHNVSPSGAESVGAKIQEHVGALQDLKA